MSTPDLNAQTILAQQQGPILRLTLNRRDKKNALTYAMYVALAEHLLEAPEQGVRVIVLEALGDAFCSGNDINDFMQAAAQQPDTLRAPLDFLQAIAACPLPIVIAVNGLAVGIGASMLLHADLVIAAEEATLQMPFVKLGLVPEGGSTLLMPAMVGHRRAFETLVLGERFSAHEGKALGLINRVVAGQELTHAVTQVAERLAAMPAAAVQQSKALLKAPVADELARVIEEEGRQFLAMLRSDEARQAFTAFLGQRAAS